MAKLTIVNKENATTGEVDLSSSITDVEYHPYIVKEAVVQYRAEVRQGTHSVKARSDVTGSTKKLWRQKGTGRARAGSAKSPIWRHGGVAFGPLPRDHAVSINRKVRKKALTVVLAEKIRQNDLLVLDSIELETHKTKGLKGVLSKLESPSALIIVNDVSRNLQLASRNLENVHVLSYRSLNVYEMLRFPRVIISKDALSALEKRLV